MTVVMESKGEKIEGFCKAMEDIRGKRSEVRGQRTWVRGKM